MQRSSQTINDDIQKELYYNALVFLSRCQFNEMHCMVFTLCSPGVLDLGTRRRSERQHRRVSPNVWREFPQPVLHGPGCLHPQDPGESVHPDLQPKNVRRRPLHLRVRHLPDRKWTRDDHPHHARWVERLSVRLTSIFWLRGLDRKKSSPFFTFFLSWELWAFYQEFRSTQSSSTLPPASDRLFNAFSCISHDKRNLQRVTDV